MVEWIEDVSLGATPNRSVEWVDGDIDRGGGGGGPRTTPPDEPRRRPKHTRRRGKMGVVTWLGAMSEAECQECRDNALMEAETDCGSGGKYENSFESFADCMQIRRWTRIAQECPSECQPVFAPPAEYPWKTYSDKTRDLQRQINTGLAAHDYCLISTDGKLGGATCGAASLLFDLGGTTMVSVPAACGQRQSEWKTPRKCCPTGTTLDASGECVPGGGRPPALCPDGTPRPASGVCPTVPPVTPTTTTGKKASKGGLILLGLVLVGTLAAAAKGFA